MTNSNIKKIISHYEKSKISEQTKIREILQQTALLGLQWTLETVVRFPLLAKGQVLTNDMVLRAIPTVP